MIGGGKNFDLSQTDQAFRNLAMFAAILRASLRDAFNLLVRGLARLRVQYPRPTF